MSLRIQGTTRAVSVLGLSLRFMVEFWGPIIAVVMINLQLGAATDLDAVKSQITRVVGVEEIPILDASTEALLLAQPSILGEQRLDHRLEVGDFPLRASRSCGRARPAQE